MKVQAIELSKITGTSKVNISNQTKKNKLIRGTDGLYDTDDLINRDWLLRHGVKTESLKPAIIKQKADQQHVQKPKIEDSKPKEVVPATNNVEIATLAGLPERLLGLNIKQLVMTYGSAMQLKSYVDILNTMMSAAKRDVEIQVRRGDLIEKKFVEYVVMYLNTLSGQLMDYSESVVDEIESVIKSDPDNARNRIKAKLTNDFAKLIAETKKIVAKEIDKNKKKSQKNNIPEE